MARIPQVTRTFQTTKATVIVVDTETNEVATNVVTLPRRYKDTKSLEKACRQAVETGTLKFVTCKSTETVEELRSMTEEEFIRYSHVIPARTAKAE